MRPAVIYGVSLVVHLGLAGAVASIHRAPRRERVAVQLREIRKPAARPAETAPPPPPAEPPKAAPRKLAASRPRAAPAPAAPAAAPAPSAAPAAAAAVPEFGLTLGGGPGGGGLAVPAAAPARQEAPHPARPKLLAAARPGDDDGCAEEPVKPKPINVVQPAYTDDARAAQVEGKVRVQLTVAADGTVESAQVLQGLGHGLDEAALEAARASSFEPGTRCGKTVAATFTIGMRFSL